MSTIAEWRERMKSAPVADPIRLIGEGALVVLAPHPDDETIGCSSLLLACAEARRAVAVVALTDGEGSHRGSALTPPLKLAEIRRAEQEAAVACLYGEGAEWLRLSLPDGASARSPRLIDAVESVAALCRRLGASALAAPHPDDPHPDHHAAAAIAHAVRDRRPALRLLNYEVWSRRLTDETPFRREGLTPFRLPTDIRAKRAALQEHASQLGRVVTDDPEGFALPDWFLAEMEEPAEPFSWAAMPGEVPGPEHFARLYADDGDPWHVRSSAYEREKREAALAILGSRRHARALEAGCGEGHLTGALVSSGLADEAVGIDREPSIVERAANRDFGPAARFAVGSLPHDLPDGPFDLVVFSEILYFLREPELDALAEGLKTRVEDGASILLVSYRGPTGTPLSGTDAADFFIARLGQDVRSLATWEEPEYRLDLLQWRGGDAEAPADGAASQTNEGDASPDAG